MVANKVLPDQTASRLISHQDCPKVLSDSTVREFGLALCSPVNRPHLPPQELDIQGISTPFFFLRLLPNISYRTYVGTVIPCTFDQVVPDTQDTPKLVLNSLRPWPNMHVCRSLWWMAGLEFSQTEQIVAPGQSLHCTAFSRQKTLVLVISTYIAPERSDQNICSTSNISFPKTWPRPTAAICCHAKSACATHLIKISRINYANIRKCFPQRIPGFCQFLNKTVLVWYHKSWLLSQLYIFFHALKWFCGRKRGEKRKEKTFSTAVWATNSTTAYVINKSGNGGLLKIQIYL